MFIYHIFIGYFICETSDKFSPGALRLAVSPRWGSLRAVARRYRIRTYGCQMNLHDSEKVANLLHHAGYREAAEEAEADLLLINTCSIRDKAEQKLYGDLGALRGWKAGAERILGVGGCVAQQQGDALLRRFPHLDFVFGTHNLRLVPAMIEAAQAGRRQARIRESRSPARFDLPAPHADFAGSTPGRAWLTVMEGCDMFCSFCIVPRTRGREISRPAGAVLDEARGLAARGVREVTLLGQTVNAYGRHAWRRARAGGEMPFAELLRALAKIPGLARLRYTSPHPLFFDEGLIRAHAELPALCPHVHLPLQSGSDRVLRAMRRRYTAREFLALVRRLRAARPDLALTTDLIVGFPGETRADFQATLAVVREAGFTDGYSFKFSPRPGTAAAAAGFGEPVAPQEAQARLAELQELLRSLTLAAHRSRVGQDTEVLVEGASARSGAPGRPRQLRGRDPYHRVVNFAAPHPPPAPGDLLPLRIAEATPHSLIGVLPEPAGLRIVPGAPEGWRGALTPAQRAITLPPRPAGAARAGSGAPQ